MVSPLSARRGTIATRWVPVKKEVAEWLKNLSATETVPGRSACPVRGYDPGRGSRIGDADKRRLARIRHGWSNDLGHISPPIQGDHRLRRERGERIWDADERRGTRIRHGEPSDPPGRTGRQRIKRILQRIKAHQRIRPSRIRHPSIGGSPVRGGGLRGEPLSPHRFRATADYERQETNGLGTRTNPPHGRRIRHGWPNEFGATANEDKKGGSGVRSVIRQSAAVLSAAADCGGNRCLPTDSGRPQITNGKRRTDWGRG